MLPPFRISTAQVAYVRGCATNADWQVDRRRNWLSWQAAELAAISKHQLLGSGAAAFATATLGASLLLPLRLNR